MNDEIKSEAKYLLQKNIVDWLTSALLIKILVFLYRILFPFVFCMLVLFLTEWKQKGMKLLCLSGPYLPYSCNYWWTEVLKT